MKIERRDALLLILVLLMTLSVAHDFLGEEKQYVGGPSPQESPRLGEPGWSGWIALPPSYRRIQMVGRTSGTTVRGMDIVDGRYRVSVGLGEFTDPADGALDFFAITVLHRTKEREVVIGYLRFPLEYVSEDRLRAPAEQVIALDHATQVVTFDLGKSVFKFQLPQQ